MGMFAGMLVAIFAFLTMIAAYALGGYVAGRMRTPVAGAGADEVAARDGVHGLTVWALSTIIGAVLAFGAVSGAVKTAADAAGATVQAGGQVVGGALQGAGQLAGGVVSGVGQMAGGAVQGAGEAAGGGGGLSDMLPPEARENPLDYITDRLLRPQESAPQPYSDADLRQQIAGIVGSVLRNGELSDDDRAYLARAVAARTNLSEAEANARIDDAVGEVTALRDAAQQRLDEAKAAATQARDEAQQRIDQAKQEAIAAAEKARRAAVWGACLLAVSSLIAGAAAFAAAIRGGRDRDAGTVWSGLLHGPRG
ncbi:MAG: hypothetical protein DI556_16795 [Rhodovulum sulfidophilum]|uniref:ATP synthase F0 subunit B n=1 Tax=Rhodovulum sulfidophilum TaxID=35806 RepID=A0A2W5NA72_RHOSU|nr:MAG: hypothetical protein DI556_16795 [Rhodovulum sulfidophilum]